jgi:hypothetical protein
MVSSATRHEKSAFSNGEVCTVCADAAFGELAADSVVDAAHGITAPTFDESADWLRKTAPAKPDFDKGEKWTRKRQDALTRRMTDAEEDWAEMDEKQREERTLRPDDGRTAEEAKKLETR